MPAIRNNILMVLAHKTSGELMGAEGKVKLAGELQRATARAIGIDVDEPEPKTRKSADAPKKKKKKKKADVDTADPGRALFQLHHPVTRTPAGAA
jgi:flagellar FliL protein